MAAGHSLDAARWQTHFNELMGRIGGRFARVEPRRHVAALVCGLLSDLVSKNCWTIAEYVGDVTPDGLQHLLRKAVWDTDGVRDELRSYVVEHLGGADAVLVVDETGDLKKGTHTVGTQRQYTGTAGRVENAQVAVYLAYASRYGHALIDRALYLPRSWTEDTERRGEAGVPDEVVFATKPALAREMSTSALDAGVGAGWVAGDEVYGADPGLRATRQARGVGYVLAVACSHRVHTRTGPTRADTVAVNLPRHAWQRLSAGQDSKGPRFYDWARISINADGEPRRNAVATAAPQQHHRRTGLLPLLQPPAGAHDHPRGRGRAPLDRRRIIPSQQRPDRAGPAPAAALGLLAPLDHPGHARLRLPRRTRRHRTGPHPPTGRAGPADLQRDPPPASHSAHPARPRPPAPTALVNLAPTTPTSRQNKPLQTTNGGGTTMKITIYGCSTRQLRGP